MRGTPRHYGVFPSEREIRHIDRRSPALVLRDLLRTSASGPEKTWGRAALRKTEGKNKAAVRTVWRPNRKFRILRRPGSFQPGSMPSTAVTVPASYASLKRTIRRARQILIRN